MAETPSLSTPGTPLSASSPDAGEGARRQAASALDVAESLGFAHLPERDFFALSLDTSLLPVELPDEENGGDEADPEAENSPSEAATTGDAQGGDESDPAPVSTPSTENPAATAASSPEPPPDTGGEAAPDISATLRELEKILEDLAPALDVTVAPPLVEAPHPDPAAVPVPPASPVPAPRPRAPLSPAALSPQKADDVLLPLPDIDIAPFVPPDPEPETPLADPALPAGRERVAPLPKPRPERGKEERKEERKGKERPLSPAPPSPIPTNDRKPGASARSEAPRPAAVARPVPSHATPVESAGPARAVSGRSPRPQADPARPDHSGHPDQAALRTLAELKRLLTELAASAPGKEVPPSFGPTGPRPEPHPLSRRTGLDRTAAPAPTPTRTTAAAGSPAFPQRRLAHMAHIPLVDPDPPTPAPRAATGSASSGAASPAAPDPSPAPAPPPSSRPEPAPRPHPVSAAPPSSPAPVTPPSWPTRLAVRLKRLLGSFPKPVPDPGRQAAATREDATPSSRREELSGARRSAPMPGRAGVSPHRPALSPTAQAPDAATGGAPSATVTPAPPVSGPWAAEPPDPGDSARPSRLARLLARLRRARPTRPEVSDKAVRPGEQAPSASGSGSLVRRLLDMEAEHRARLVRLTDRPRGPIYPSWEARRHLLDVSLPTDGTVDPQSAPAPDQDGKKPETGPLHVLREETTPTADTWKMALGVAALTVLVGVLLYAAMNPDQTDHFLETVRRLF